MTSVLNKASDTSNPYKQKMIAEAGYVAPRSEFRLPFSDDTIQSASGKPAIQIMKKSSRLSVLSFCKSIFHKITGKTSKPVERSNEPVDELEVKRVKAAAKPELEKPKQIEKEQLLKCISEIETIINAAKKLNEETEDNEHLPQNVREAILFLRSLKMMSSQKDLLDEAALERSFEMGFKQQEHKANHEKYMELVAKKDKITKSKKFWGRLEMGFSITTITSFALAFVFGLLSSASGGSLAPLMSMLNPGLQTLGSTAMLMEGIGKLKSGLLEYDLGQKMSRLTDLKHQSTVHETVLDQLSAELTRTQDQMLEICKQMRRTLVNSSETVTQMRA